MDKVAHTGSRVGLFIMNRRDFLKRLGLATAATQLSPLLDLCPIEDIKSAAILDDEFVCYMTYYINMIVHNPGHCVVITGITE